MTDDFASQVEGVGALAEPARRTLYLYVVAQPGPVSRDQAAAGAGLARHTAKFHLDKLVDEGLLTTEFRRLTGRQGPGAGRPAKLYRRSERQVSVTLPERQYDVAGRILANALEEVADEAAPVRGALERAATDAGRAMAEAAPPRRKRSGDALDHVAQLLASRGYEPHRQGDTVVLANCPFHALAREHTQLVCGMNLDVISAALDSLGHDDVEARLDPDPDRCCVTLSKTSGARRRR
ncbi:MAG: helix-turn-helix transcriptional regulator [Actinomycetes bacterium]